MPNAEDAKVTQKKYKKENAKVECAGFISKHTDTLGFSSEFFASFA
jgi:hypothetical protein